MSADRIVVVGAGVAGLATALRLAPLPVTLVSAVPLGEGTATAWAQGGIAAAVGRDDAPARHAADTRAAGAGLTDPEVARRVTEAAPGLIDWLAGLGVAFDRDAEGAPALGLEAAHGRRRIVRAGGDATGPTVLGALIRAVAAAPSVSVRVGRAVRLLRDADGGVAGIGLSAGSCPARAVVLATGGIGGLYAATTNPEGATGSGLALAARAGAVLRDVEFVQFHPTAIAVRPGGSLPLATEALRGEGAVLVDRGGGRVMAGVAGGDLAPRDVVARAIFSRLRGGEPVYLDARGLDVARLFPTVAALCRAAGLDPARAPIPVRPAAHYQMGGVRVDGSGAASVPGLWACGEVAATGLHGANRLASNSLLEALAYAGWIADAIKGSAGLPPRPAADPPAGPARAAGAAPGIAEIRRIMEAEVGLVRDEAGLARAVAGLAAPAQAGVPEAVAALLVAAAALRRRESRGAHWRADHPAEPPAAQAPAGQAPPAQAPARHADITLAQALGLAQHLTLAEAPAP
ncbi:L-aspartate oxidase [Methylobacterium crusticola]|uniref:L-aspartate oxidase n=1 Tax=Methylobacterium crusticola TaxID=1697972 RepID=A0ABQ4QTW9_9HYPH|nr:L-aspartate oxidase [Methylobacterium crusticola]GJD48778.1 L-aspartate oxidase [Methylobacterium crusticola]